MGENVDLSLLSSILDSLAPDDLPTSSATSSSSSVERPFRPASSIESHVETPLSPTQLNADELERLLDQLMLESSPVKQEQDEQEMVAASASCQTTTAKQSKSTSRCVELVLGGAVCARGHKNSAFSKRVCDNILCLHCNFQISCFPQRQWKSEMSYIFLRTNLNLTTNDNSKLEAMLDQKAEWVAYCCQCTFISQGAGEEKVSPFDGREGALSWYCGGHS